MAEAGAGRLGTDSLPDWPLFTSFSALVREG